jgi:Spy/CpxP family protein refolding chaperone
MKKTIWLALIVVALSAVVSFAVARWSAARRQPTASQVHDAAWLKRQLRLTGEQAGAVEKLVAEFRKQLEGFCATHCNARIALGDELMKPGVDDAACRAHVEKMNAAQSDAERATLAHILKVRALLNDEQARRYSALIRDQVCAMPMGAP